MLVEHRRYRIATVIAGGVLLLAVALGACTGGDDSGGDGVANDARTAELAAAVDALRQTLDAVTAENAALKDEVAALRQEQADFVEAQGAVEAAREDPAGDADPGPEQDGQMTVLEERQDLILKRLDSVEARLKALEDIVVKVAPLLDLLDPSLKGEGGLKPEPMGDVVERTARLAEAFGGEVYYVGNASRGDRTVLVTPTEVVAGETPLIVSLHGFGGDSFLHSSYLPLHERVNADGFGLLLPNGQTAPDGSRFWNPTDVHGGKAGLNDVAYLTELIADARAVKDFGPVYVIGYSNGGFMAHHLGCKGVPGLSAVASLAGTSYVDDSSCVGAAPVSVLHIHGTADDVLRFGGDESIRFLTPGGDAAFYIGAREIVSRWSDRAGCAWPANAEPYATLDFDAYVPGAETRAYRQASGCAAGVTIELWEGEGTGHLPGYGVAFVDALVEWLLARG